MDPPFATWTDAHGGYPLRLDDGRIVAIPEPPADLNEVFWRVLGAPAWRPSAITGPEAELYTTTHYSVAAIRHALRPHEGKLWDLAQAVRFGIAGDRSVNAAAFRSPEPTIAVNLGTLETLRAVSYNALSNPQCYPTIDAGTESRERARVLDANDIGGALRTRAYIDGPLSPSRRFIAQLLFVDAVVFLFAHELGHLIRRHDRLLGLSNPFSCITEARQKDALDAARNPHAPELDADRFAVLLSLAGHVREEAGHRSQMFRVRLWVASVTLLFFILDDERAGWPGTGSTHPHPLVRWSLLPLHALELYGGNRRDDLFEAHRQAIEDLAIILKVVGLPQYEQIPKVLADAGDVLHAQSMLAFKQLRELMDELGSNPGF